MSLTALAGSTGALITLEGSTRDDDGDASRSFERENGTFSFAADALAARQKAKSRSCKVPKHAEEVWGEIWGARQSLCYDEQLELNEGDACDTACPTWYKAPYPVRVWCSCDATGQACSLQPVADSTDISPVMMNFVRCPTSYVRLIGIPTPFILIFCALPYFCWKHHSDQQKDASRVGNADGGVMGQSDPLATGQSPVVSGDPATGEPVYEQPPEEESTAQIGEEAPAEQAASSSQELPGATPEGQQPAPTSG